MTKKLKVFITGATGFVGSNIARNLAMKNEFGVHIIHRPNSNMWRIQEILPKIMTHSVDIADKKGLHAAVKKIQPDIIFHLANVGVYGGLEGNPEDIIRSNLIGTINLVEALRSVPYLCFVNTGSSSEYGPKAAPMKERDYCEPESIYAISKLAATIYTLQEAKRNKKPIVNVRLFSPFGPYDSKARLISYAIKQASENEPMHLNTRTAVRDYVYVDDVVDAYLLCVKHIDAVRGEVLNIGSGSETSVSDIVKLVKNVTGSRSKIIWKNQKSNRFESEVWRADTKKVKRLLSWKPKITLREGIQKTLAWHQENNKTLTED